MDTNEDSPDALDIESRIMRQKSQRSNVDTREETELSRKFQKIALQQNRLTWNGSL